VNIACTGRLILTLVALAVCVCTTAFTRSPDSKSNPQGQAQPLAVECVDLSLDQIDTEKVTFALKLAINGGQDLDLDQVTLANVHLNGLPIFAAPLDGPIHLLKGQRIDLQKPVFLTVYLRDVTSTKPLSQALVDGFATLDGEIYVSVHLGAIARIVVRSSQAVVPMKLQQKVPVAVPGGTLAKAAALTVLDAAEVALKHLRAGVSASQGIWPGLRHDILQQYAPAAFAVVVTYSLSDAHGEEVPLSWNGVAFRISPTELVLPDEALEPWAFDLDAAAAIQSGVYKLEPNTFKLSVWTTGQDTRPAGGGGMQLGQQLQAVPSKPQTAMQVMLLSKSHLPQKGKLDVRATDSNVAFLKSSESLPSVPTPRTASGSTAEQWETVALLRFPRLATDKLIPEVILTSAYLDHGRIHLGVKVDSTVFGSPIIAPSGIVGMVQDESSGIAWSKIAESINTSK
jgi:hypothetical protein